MTSKLSRELYFAFIYSKIKYAIEVYGNLSFHKYELNSNPAKQIDGDVVETR